MSKFNKLVEKLNKELNDFKNKIKDIGVEYAINHAYELTIKQTFIDVIDSSLYDYDEDVDNEDFDLLLKTENVLDKMYDEWIDSDYSLMDLNDQINDCIVNCIEGE